MLAASGRSGLEAEYLRRFEDDLHGLRVLTFSMLRLSAGTVRFAEHVSVAVAPCVPVRHVDAVELGDRADQRRG